MHHNRQLPLLTIAVITHNRWSGCRTAVEALIHSRTDNVELLVVDDCSKQLPPPDLLVFFECNNVRYYRHETNRGLAAARNTAIEVAQGIFFSFCDDDDVWTDDMIPRFVDVCSKLGKEVGIIIGYPETRSASCDTLQTRTSLYRYMVEGITPPVAAQVYRVSALKEVNGYRDYIKSGVDHDLWVSLAGTKWQCECVFEISPIICPDVLADRMTMVEHKRRSGISDSLDIWAPEIVQLFGADFNRHFRNCYEQHLNYSFFRQSVISGNILEAAKRILNYGVFPILIRHLLRVVKVRKSCGAFATFKQNPDKRC